MKLFTSLLCLVCFVVNLQAQEAVLPSSKFIQVSFSGNPSTKYRLSYAEPGQKKFTVVKEEGKRRNFSNYAGMFLWLDEQGYELYLNVGPMKTLTGVVPVNFIFKKKE